MGLTKDHFYGEDIPGDLEAEAVAEAVDTTTSGRPAIRPIKNAIP
jgi:hypothetical protein